MTADTFQRGYSERRYSHPVILRHQGTVLAFAMADDRRIVYSALDPGKGERDAHGWLEQPKELRFATELAHVGFGAAEQTQVPAFRKGASTPVDADTVLAAEDTAGFRASTAPPSAPAPVQGVRGRGL